MILALLVLSVAFALRFVMLDDSPPVVTFVGYTNEPTGLYRFAAFRISNQTRHHVGCVQGPLEVKSPAGWIEDNNHTGYQHGGASPGKEWVITLLAPTTNRVWRATFQFQATPPMRPRWQERIRSAFARIGVPWREKQKTYVVTTGEIAS